MSTSKPRVAVFYALKDQRMKEELSKHLLFVDIVDLFTVTESGEWERDRKEAMKKVDCILLLLSPDFMSDSSQHREGMLILNIFNYLQEHKDLVTNELVGYTKIRSCDIEDSEFEKLTLLGNAGVNTGDSGMLHIAMDLKMLLKSKGLLK